MENSELFAIALDPMLVIQVWDVDEDGNPINPDNEEEE